ncbi:hypothetical protein BDV3_005100 [Batrachochytrium dendrobatidis]|nr:hypothetical protein BDEG_24345 [Batrachochytrium dendrobatidis JEL423]
MPTSSSTAAMPSIGTDAQSKHNTKKSLPSLNPTASEFIPVSSVATCGDSTTATTSTAGVAVTTITANSIASSKKSRKNRRGNSGKSRPSSTSSTSCLNTSNSVVEGSSSTSANEQSARSRKNQSLSTLRNQARCSSTPKSPSKLPSGLHFSLSKLSDTPSSVSDQQNITHPRNNNGGTRLKGSRGGRKNNTCEPSGEKSTADLLEALTDDLTNQLYDCMVCYDTVKTRDSIWNCSVCYAVFHLKCISQWARKSSQEYNGNEPTRSMESWRCPGCQTMNDCVPIDYKCFCTKIINPAVNAYSCPHSCGQTCGKDRNCTHKCPVQCHPGPCPPCELSAPPLSCYCGDGKLVVRCTELSSIDFQPSCGNTCSKKLRCGNHSCTMICHPPPCRPCLETISVSCFCGAEEHTIPCGDQEDGYSCGKLCTHKYACDIHSCDRPCHEDKHEGTKICPLDPSIVVRCPCGKFSISELSPNEPRLTCDQPILTCQEFCDKKLACGHTCESICHSGECSLCNRLVTIFCRCGKQEIKTSCSTLTIDPSTGLAKPPLCARPCGKRLTCRRHNCQDTCCKKSTEMHACESACNKRLACKLHNCMLPCGHQGKCHDCVEGVSFEELSCSCGRTIMYPPIPCNTPPLKCNHPCRRRRPCGHSDITAHYCHDDSESCPPCTTFVERRCACQATIMPNVPCSRQGAPSCVKLCPKTIDGCGHACQRICHAGLCVNDSYRCLEKCGKVRSICGHSCTDSCHGTRECIESTFCKQAVKHACPCGNRSVTTVCGALQGKLAISPNMECDESCLQKQRNERLANALGIDTTELDTPSGAPINAVYSDSLIRSALSFKSVVLATQKTLAELVNDPSKQYFYFPKQRMFSANTLILELAPFYGFAAALLDANVGKGTVVVRRVANRPPFIPDKLLSEVAEEYDPNAPVATSNDTVDLKLDLDPFIPNAVLVRGVPLEAEVDNIKAILRPICNFMNMAATLSWISDIDFLVTYERYAVWGSIKEKEAEVPSILADRINAAMVTDIGWATNVVECQVFHNGTIRLEDNHVLKRDTSNSAISVRRIADQKDDGWKFVKSSKNPGVPINDDFIVPSMPEQIFGESSSGKRGGSHSRWYDGDSDF